ncbi:MAG: ATP-binding cassette domain-containing protein, partial [Nitrospirae bacterium]|nr:ATP-binding cassette domain-containing protein [Nitrospirota bacterium]
VAFNMLSGRVSGPVLRIVRLWQDFQQTGVSVNRLGDVLNTPAEPSFGGGRAMPSCVNGNVVFDGVTFRYRHDGPAILRNVSFDIQAGEVIGIVGRSGSGKSTVAKLIQRLYVPEGGRIMIDGLDVSHMHPAWLRRQTGVVLQENFLFNSSVRDNIALADPGVPMERVIQAAKLAGAHDFISELTGGYDTMVGEHGSSLSGGQRQRIAIARALITNPRILIFDEATSALDYESESMIQRNMKEICRNRTVFIIAHRLSTVRGADRIFVIDRGAIVEEGAHSELVETGGYYARLNAIQNGVCVAA